MKPIRLSAHAIGYISRRGFTKIEVEETIRTAPWQPAELGRTECRKEFPFGREWNGNYLPLNRCGQFSLRKRLKLLS